MRRLGRYRRWSVRLSCSTLAQIKRLALDEGWEISDLVRALVVLAATVTWLGLDKPKNLDALREISALGQMRDALERGLLSMRTHRPYPAVRGNQDTYVMTLILPTGVANLIESLAAAKIVSKNDSVSGLLTKGLILYMTGEHRLLEALQSLGT